MTHNTPAPVADKALAERLARMATSPRDSGLFDLVLTDAYRSGQLLTLADHERTVHAAVAKAVEAALREHTGREETGESITEKYLRRYPRSKKTRAWEGAMVHLRTQNGIWRLDGHGYTLHFSEALVLPLADARKIVSGIYEDHGGTYYRVSAAAIRSRGVAT